MPTPNDHPHPPAEGLVERLGGIDKSMTPGEWGTSKPERITSGPAMGFSSGMIVFCVAPKQCAYTTAGATFPFADLTGIVALRNSLPEIIATLRAQSAEIAVLKLAVEKLTKIINGIEDRISEFGGHPETCLGIIGEFIETAMPAKGHREPRDPNPADDIW